MARPLGVRITRSILALMYLTCMVAVIVAAWLSLVKESYRELRTSSCNANLKYILHALRNYHDIYRCFPPSYVTDAVGRPMHSWRVLLLAADPATYDLYTRYDFNESWDGPTNRLLADQMPSFYRCPNSSSETAASYCVVVGRGTAFPGAEPTTLSEITRPRGSTVLLVEVGRSRPHWMEPRDLDLETLSSGKDDMSIVGSFDIGGAGLGLADGSVMRTGRRTVSKWLRPMLMIK